MSSASRSLELEAVFAGLDHGLHAFAQPLTILSGRTDPGRAERMSVEQLRQAVAGSCEQVEQLCSLLQYLRQLVDTATTQPVLAPVQVSALLAMVSEGVSLPVREAGMFLLEEAPPGDQTVLADWQRTAQALSSVLLVLFSMSSAPDMIELCAVAMPETVRIVVRNESCAHDRMDARTKLSLALAEVCIRSQQGDFSLSLNPFIATIDLPKAPAAAEVR